MGNIYIYGDILILKASVNMKSKSTISLRKAKVYNIKS